MDSKEMKRFFGLRVQSLRRRKSMTQQQLADDIGKSLDTVSNIERGFSSTRIETASHIADVLGVTLAELFDFGPPVAGDKEKRKAVERLVRLVECESTSTVDTLTRMAELALSLRMNAND